MILLYNEVVPWGYYFPDNPREASNRVTTFGVSPFNFDAHTNPVNQRLLVRRILFHPSHPRHNR